MATVTNGASTTSRRPDRMLTDLRAVFYRGNRVTLTDGREYIDHQSGLHGAIFGASPIWWRETLRLAIEQGPISSIAHQNEQVVAGMLSHLYPDVQSVRFGCNGSDPCAASVKLARAVTMRDKILSFGYHGWSASFCPGPSDVRPNLGERAMNLGTLQAERDAYKSLDWLDPDLHDKAITYKPAMIIIECPPVDGGKEEATRWLHDCADVAQANGSLFVLDEVVTGFRYAPGGAAEYYDLLGKVDLYCFGKTLGNAYPISALAGRKNVLDFLVGGNEGQVHWSGTFFGDSLGLAVAKATLNQLMQEPPWDHMYHVGNALIERWNKLSLPWKMTGHPTRPVIHPTPHDKRFDDLRRHLMRGDGNQPGHIFVSHPLYVTMATTMVDVIDLCEKAGRWASEWGNDALAS